MNRGDGCLGRGKEQLTFELFVCIFIYVIYLFVCSFVYVKAEAHLAQAGPELIPLLLG